MDAPLSHQHDNNATMNHWHDSHVIGLLEDVLSRLDRIEAAVAGKPRKTRYLTGEAAMVVGRSPWSVRHDCERGAIKATKELVGGAMRWVIPDQEVVRLLNLRSPEESSDSPSLRLRK